jgi:hypothetical protein
MGIFGLISILPPRWTRKVRSETFPIVTPSTAARASVSSRACSVSVAAQVTSMRRCSCSDAVTSSAVTTPPDSSTARVSRLTALPPATRRSTSTRMVIE